MDYSTETTVESKRLSTVKTMSSREIAELTGKRHDNVLADIEKILEKVGIAALKFEAGYLDKNNQKRKEYLLPYREALLVTSGYDPKQRLKIIDRWAELEFEKRQKRISVSKAVSPTSYIKAFTFIQQTLEETGLKENQLLLATNRGAAKLTGFDLLASSEVTYLLSSSNDEYLTVTQIGQKLNPVMGAQSLNEWLTSLGLQIPKHTRKGFVPTPEGEELGGRMMDTALKYTDGSTQYLKWNSSIIVPYLQNLINTKNAERSENE